MIPSDTTAKIMNREFVRESLGIEGIFREPTDAEMAEFDRFMKLESVVVQDLEQFVKIYEPNAKLRNSEIVTVAGYIPPIGPKVYYMLVELLGYINAGEIDSHQAHIEFESIHPFTDGNGRSGRMLWRWMEREQMYIDSFLREFYYQTLRKDR